MHIIYVDTTNPCLIEKQPEQLVKKGNYILNFFLFFLLHSTILSACQYVGSTDPTVLPIRKPPLALMFDPLDNHKIAFGVAHFALRQFSRWCVQLRSRYCPHMHGRVGGTSSHPHSASDFSFGVRLCIHPHLSGLWFRASIPPVTISTLICGDRKSTRLNSSH